MAWFVQHRLASPPYDVVTDKENQKYKQNEVEHPSVVTGAGHGLDSLQATSEQASRCVKFLVHVT